MSENLIQSQAVEIGLIKGFILSRQINDAIPFSSVIGIAESSFKGYYGDRHKGDMQKNLAMVYLMVLRRLKAFDKELMAFYKPLRG